MKYFFCLLLAVAWVSFPSHGVKADAETPATEAECKAYGGVCSTYCVTSLSGKVEVGKCNDNTLSTTCCGVKKAQAVTPQGTAPLVEAICDQQPNLPQCKAGQAVTTTAGSVGPVSAGTIALYDPMGGRGVYGLFQSLISIFFGFAGAIALLVFIYSGVVYMTAGSSDRVKTAIEAMKYAALGLIIIIFAYSISFYFIKALTTDTSSTAGANAQPTGASAQLLQ
jgi:hypothetical protein